MSEYHLDISHTRTHLEKAGIRPNRDDEIFVDGDLGELEGHVALWGGRGPTIRFKIIRRDNGIFVDYNDGYGKTFIKKVA